MNDDHICTIAEAFKLVLESVDGLSAVSFQAFDVTNPPASYEANIQLLMGTNDPISSSSEYDPFSGKSNKTPAVDRHERGIMVDIVKRGTNWLDIQNLAGRCYNAILNSQEIADLVDSIRYDGSIPSHSDPQSDPFVSVALIFVLRYSTEAGQLGRRIHS